MTRWLMHRQVDSPKVRFDMEKAASAGETGVKIELESGASAEGTARQSSKMAPSTVGRCGGARLPFSLLLSSLLDSFSASWTLLAGCFGGALLTLQRTELRSTHSLTLLLHSHSYFTHSLTYLLQISRDWLNARRFFSRSNISPIFCTFRPNFMQIAWLRIKPYFRLVQMSVVSPSIV